MDLAEVGYKNMNWITVTDIDISGAETPGAIIRKF
jgi:hypothetical protein